MFKAGSRLANPALAGTQTAPAANDQGADTFLSDFYHTAATTALSAAPLDAIVQSEAEDTITDWLEAHKVANAWKLAPMLVTAALSTAQLDQVSAHVTHDA
jgi:hypothetical protein